MIVLRRISQNQVAYGRVVKPVKTKQNWPKSVDVRGVQVIPNLTITVNGPSTKDIDIISSEFEERCNILEDKAK